MTAVAVVGVGASKKKSSSSRRKSPKPLDRAQVEAIVEQAISEQGLAANLNGVITAVGTSAAKLVNQAIDALKAIANGVFVFLGKVYKTAKDAIEAVFAWLKGLASRVTGAAKQAFTQAATLIGSMNREQVTEAAVKVLAAAAALGIGLTTGVAVGGVMAGLAASLSAPVVMAQVTGILFAGITAGCTFEVCNVLFNAGFQYRQIAAALSQAQAQARASQVTIVDAVPTTA